MAPKQSQTSSSQWLSSIYGWLGLDICRLVLATSMSQLGLEIYVMLWRRQHRGTGESGAAHSRAPWCVSRLLRSSTTMARTFPGPCGWKTLSFSDPDTVISKPTHVLHRGTYVLPCLGCKQRGKKAPLLGANMAAKNVAFP